MRALAALGVLGVFAALALAQGQTETKGNRRYDFEPDLRRFPQTTPKDTLASVLKAIDQKRIGYLAAHLADPQFIDERVKDRGGDFDQVVREITTKLNDNPDAVKELRQLLKEGEWEGGEEAKASVQLKDAKDKRAHFRKIDNRWYLENRKK